jgi:3-carboxy-cis,cis-muconate cycloisomerase
MSPLPTFDPGFSTEELTDLYSPESTVTALLAFEASLALALADAGLAPRAEAEATAEACGSGVEDPLAILASTWETGTPILALRDDIGGGEWFHYGATTQDAVDTAQMIQARSALSILDAHLVGIVTRLRDLTNEHRHQPQMGRTFLQDARPTTFGFRTASWLDAVAGHVVELRHQQSLLPVQLGGPVGTGDAYGDKGSEVVDALATRLGLRAPDISWHSDRSGVLALAQGVERMTRTLARIGNDIALLASSSIAEVKVRSGGSSSMPEKQNPLDAIRAVAAATACGGATAMVTTAPTAQLDRGIGGWHVEWLALPLVFQTAGAAAEAMESCLDSMEVDTARMGAGLEAATSDNPQIDAVLAACEEILGQQPHSPR